jgi:hypothetical protein
MLLPAVPLHLLHLAGCWVLFLLLLLLLLL